MEPEENKRQIINLGLVSLFNDLSSEVITRVLPLFLIIVAHTSFVGLGVVESISEATSTLGKLISGFYSDKYSKRKPVVFVGYALSVLSRPLLLINPSSLTASFARFLEKVGKSIRTPARDALISDLSDGTNRGKNFGINRALDTLGAMIGLSVVFLYLHFNPQSEKSALQNILICGCAVGLIALFVLGFGVKEPPLKENIQKTKIKISFSALNGKLKYYLLVAFVFALSTSSDAFIIVRARENGFSLQKIFAMLVVFNAVSAIGAYFLTSLSDKKGRKSFLILGWAIYSFSYFIFGLKSISSLEFIIAVSFYGLFYSLTDGVEKALVSDFEGGQKGQAYGWLGLVQGLGLIPANLIFAAIYQQVGYTWAFWFSGVMALTGIILLSFFNFKENS